MSSGSHDRPVSLNKAVIAVEAFNAIQALRQYLEAKGYRLLCVGARPDVVPSGISRSMGGGRQAYFIRSGKQATELIDIFDYAEPALVGTVQ